MCRGHSHKHDSTPYATTLQVQCALHRSNHCSLPPPCYCKVATRKSCVAACLPRDEPEPSHAMTDLSHSKPESCPPSYSFSVCLIHTTHVGLGAINCSDNANPALHMLLRHTAPDWPTPRGRGGIRDGSELATERWRKTKLIRHAARRGHPAD